MKKISDKRYIIWIRKQAYSSIKHFSHKCYHKNNPKLEIIHIQRTGKGIPNQLWVVMVSPNDKRFKSLRKTIVWQRMKMFDLTDLWHNCLDDNINLRTSRLWNLFLVETIKFIKQKPDSRAEIFSLVSQVLLLQLHLHPDSAVA